MTTWKKIITTLLFILLLTACANSSQPETAVSEDSAATELAPEPTEATEMEEMEEMVNLSPLKAQVIETYAQLVYASYADSLTLAQQLDETLNDFVANPSPETHQAAKDAWLAAREPYGQTEAYRFYGGPIDDEDGPEGRINAWPLDEAYIDYVDGSEMAGIINDTETYPTIDADLLLSLNEMGAEENISIGYHAIEFLLWGQDLSADGAGDRPYTDYVVEGTASHPQRRGQYLLIVSDLLVTHLQEMVDAWAPETADNYRAEFVAGDLDEAIKNILTGIGVLSKSELAGERIFVAYDNQDQEDEHSCFSDNTHRDIINNALGIRNVLLGTYTRIDGTTIQGTGVIDLLETADPDLAQELSQLADEAWNQVNQIPAPFDQAIVLAEQRPLVLSSVNALQDQGDAVALAAAALDLTINTGLPE